MHAGAQLFVKKRKRREEQRGYAKCGRVKRKRVQNTDEKFMEKAQERKSE